jgi:hypothetical protein
MTAWRYLFYGLVCVALADSLFYALSQAARSASDILAIAFRAGADADSPATGSGRPKPGKS